jgi:hypothetical protein
LFPSESHTIGCKNTVLNGSLSVSHKLIITILATQKKRISCPVSRIEFGKNCLKSKLSVLGHPRIENGNNPELNQVSNTSSSWAIYIYYTGKLRSLAAFCKAYSFDLPTTQLVDDLIFPLPFFIAW